MPGSERRQPPPRSGEWVARDAARVWHGFTQMSAFADLAPVVVERGEAIVLAHGHPLTLRLLKEYVSRWEAAGIRLVPVSQLTR